MDEYINTTIEHALKDLDYSISDAIKNGLPRVSISVASAQAIQGMLALDRKDDEDGRIQ